MMNNDRSIHSFMEKLPKVLAILPGFIPSTQIDVISPLMDLYRSGVIDFRIELEITVRNSDIDWCDVIVLCRNTEPASAKWFIRVLKNNKPYIYGIDDNFFEISGDSPVAEYHRSPQRLEMLTEYVRLASSVRVYSEPLYTRVNNLNSQVYKVVAPVDFRHILPPDRNQNESVKIVYATSRSHDELSAIFIPALQKILDEYGTRVRVYFLGFTPLIFQNHPSVISVPMNWNYSAYLRAFSSAGYDIGLAPLFDDIFHRSKTNNKFREYGASQIAGIYSKVDVYSSCVTNYETGLLVENNTEAWYQAIKYYIDNPGNRIKIQKSAYEFVRSNYSQENFVRTWAGQIEQVNLGHRYENKDTMRATQLIFGVNQGGNKNGFLSKFETKLLRALKFLKDDGILSFLRRFVRNLSYYYTVIVSLFSLRFSIMRLKWEIIFKYRIFFLYRKSLSIFKKKFGIQKDSDKNPF